MVDANIDTPNPQAVLEPNHNLPHATDASQMDLSPLLVEDITLPSNSSEENVSTPDRLVPSDKNPENSNCNTNTTATPVDEVLTETNNNQMDLTNPLEDANDNTSSRDASSEKRKSTSSR